MGSFYGYHTVPYRFGSKSYNKWPSSIRLYASAKTKFPDESWLLAGLLGVMWNDCGGLYGLIWTWATSQPWGRARPGRLHLSNLLLLLLHIGHECENLSILNKHGQESKGHHPLYQDLYVIRKSRKGIPVIDILSMVFSSSSHKQVHTQAGRCHLCAVYMLVLVRQAV